MQISAKKLPIPDVPYIEVKLTLSQEELGLLTKLMARDTIVPTFLVNEGHLLFEQKVKMSQLMTQFWSALNRY